ncbi:MAG: TfoX/Sxy family protein [Candidatus Latescibacteria bacterium]|nr:TfoX/Sxy family protein [Candidatus Latescibacterota bacterium]
MAYDERLADRVRKFLASRRGVTEKRMFGGICWLVHGNMACGIVHDLLMVRVGPDSFEDALARPHTRPMDFTGRPSRGMVYVEPAGVKAGSALAAWVKRGADFAASLPKK